MVELDPQTQFGPVTTRAAGPNGEQGDEVLISEQADP